MWEALPRELKAFGVAVGAGGREDAPVSFWGGAGR